MPITNPFFSPHPPPMHLRFFFIFRFMWMGVVVIAVLIFVSQVSQRKAVYFQYITNVAVEVKHPESVTFPSVTICNYNIFRYSDVITDFRVYCRFSHSGAIKALSFGDIIGTKYKPVKSTQNILNQKTNIEILKKYPNSCSWTAFNCQRNQPLQHDILSKSGFAALLNES